MRSQEHNTGYIPMQNLKDLPDEDLSDLSDLSNVSLVIFEPASTICSQLPQPHSHDSQLPVDIFKPFNHLF